MTMTATLAPLLRALTSKPNIAAISAKHAGEIAAWKEGRASIQTRPKGNRRPSKFTERDVKRAVRAVEASGKQVGSISIGIDGSIQVAIAGADTTPDDETNVVKFNEWDALKRH